ncbi:MAG: dihydropteroate synthase [Sulfurimicrobium sp.]|nr:dihydropteroate synthase [Sulfurimicrobium sp.]MDP1705052.1 dihydropteroate synthase [Sulfurimicrobium sp.]MDP2197941.1 dihydropteroate synthase [Sulfurimicrobium sp.]
MGIVNVTPDSFSDGGHFFSSERAVDHAMQLIEQGAELLDIGAESTRPGAQAVEVEEELRRLLPVLDALSDCGVPLSVDTLKPEVMRAAIEAGADMINDVNALRAKGALQVVADSAVAVCLMHMQGEPRTMQHSPVYQDVVNEVISFLAERISVAEQAGIQRNRLMIDPGFGFGKTLEHNLGMLKRLDSFASLGVPLLAGLSRKSMLGILTGLPVMERMVPSVASAVIAAMKGAKILRVHDVKETRQALQIVGALGE